MTDHFILKCIIACASAGAAIGAILVAWAKFRWENKFTSKSELYQSDGRPIYQAKDECRIIHNQVCAQGKELKQMMKYIAAELNGLNGQFQNLNGQFQQYIRNHKDN